MESKPKGPGKRLIQLAVRDAISSKLSLNSSFKRELDRKKESRWKNNEKKENLKESLVTKEMAEIFRSVEKEKAKIGYNYKTNPSDRSSRQTYLEKRMSRSMPDPLLSENSLDINIPLFNDSDRSLTKELSLEQNKFVSTEYLTSTKLLEKHSSESMIFKENANEEVYISPPYYPDKFFMPTNPPETMISSPCIDSKKNRLSSSTSEEHHFPHLNTHSISENKRQCLDFDPSLRYFSQPNLASSRDILSTSDNPEKAIIEEHLQNSQNNSFWESKKNSNNVCRHKPLSPKKDDENEYINNLIDSFINKKSGSSSTENIEKPIHEEQQTSKTQNTEHSSFNTDISGFPLVKASVHKSQNTRDVPTIFLNFKNNVCKNETNIIEKESANLTEINNDDSNLSSHNEISIAVLCEFFKLQAMLS